jgi:signal transduction histidine kinase
VWINILSNAIKYTPSNGEIDITLFEKGGKKVVQIADTGIGIAAEDVPKIFDKYYQAESTKAGNGLGLAICKRIVDLSGGEISVQSVKGEGSTFTVKL